MTRNPGRRKDLSDAAVRVLARQGSRGLTHRALDDEAQLPRGTASNFFATKDDVIDAILARIGERLAPDPDVHASLAARQPGRELFAAYMKDIFQRLTSDRAAALALFELRLEATRRGHVEEAIRAWLHRGLADDVAFNARMGLPGGKQEVILFHYAINGFILGLPTVWLTRGVDSFLGG
ncbi:TetR/AcrR family transcriptional regulator [Arthrobacter flavus]|uniref:TetR/AcrR family transcriptional regulator n=1 Tax=Arthrobacter flavus TaxID=95172 RepID=A0ABW4Q6X6_9MICC